MKKTTSHEIRGGFGAGMIMPPGTVDGEITIRLASSDMISAGHASYHSQTRARSQLPTVSLTLSNSYAIGHPERSLLLIGIPESDFESDAVAAFSTPRLVSRKRQILPNEVASQQSLSLLGSIVFLISLSKHPTDHPIAAQRTRR